jgi:hypothetical protein
VELQERQGHFLFFSEALIHVDVNKTGIVSSFCISCAHVGIDEASLSCHLAGVLPEGIGNFVNLQRLVSFFCLSSIVAGRELLFSF